MENPQTNSIPQHHTIHEPTQSKLVKKKTATSKKASHSQIETHHEDVQNVKTRYSSIQLSDNKNSLNNAAHSQKEKQHNHQHQPPPSKKNSHNQHKLQEKKRKRKKTIGSSSSSSSSSSSDDDEGKILNQRKGLLPKDFGVNKASSDEDDEPQAQQYGAMQHNLMHLRQNSLFQIESESEDGETTNNNNQTASEGFNQNEQTINEQTPTNNLQLSVKTPSYNKNRRASHQVKIKANFGSGGSNYFSSPDQLTRKLKTITHNKVLPKEFQETDDAENTKSNKMHKIKLGLEDHNTKSKSINKDSTSHRSQKDQNSKSTYAKTQMKELMKKYLNRSSTKHQDLMERSQSKEPTDLASAKKKSKQKSPSPIKTSIYDKIMYTEHQIDSEPDTENSGVRKLKCIIRINGPHRIRWDLFVMMLAIWNCFTLPVDIALQPQVFNHPFFQFFNYFIDVIFLIDLILNFRTTYFNPRTGDEVSDPKMITITYMKSRFWLDLLATIPFDDLIGQFIQRRIAHKFQLFALVKVLRVLRVGRIITYMNSTDDIKLSLKLIKLFFFLIMFIHLQGCTWFYLIQVDKIWNPQYLTTYNINDLYTESVSTQYWALFYISSQMLVGNDVLPYGNLQVGFASFFLIAGALMNAHILGSIAVVVSTMNRKASKFQEQIDIANTAMRNMKLNEGLQWKVQDFMMYTQSNLDNQKELDAFLNMISPSLRLEVIQHIFLTSIKKNELFKSQPEIIDFIVNNIVTLLYLPDDFIIKQGQKGHHFFFLAKGDCQVWVKNQFRKDILVTSLTSGRLFGEVALIASTRRTATIKSINYCTLAALTKDNFSEMCKQFPDTYFRLKHATTQYTDTWKMFQKRMLYNVDFLMDLSNDLIEELHYMFNIEYFEENRIIFHQGNNCKAIYFVVEGQLDLYIDHNGKEQVLLDTLYQGCSLGSYSVINGHKFPYSAKSKTNLTLLTLPAKVLQEAKEYIDELEYALWEANEYIQSNGVPLCDYKIYRSHFSKNHQTMSPIQKFQDATRRVMVLNKRDQNKKYKILDVLSLIHQKIHKEPHFTDKRQKTTVQSRLPPFLQKNFIQKIKNKTANGVLQKTDKYVKRLTVKIDQLTETVNKQQNHIINMQKSFNKQLTIIANSSAQRSSRGFDSSIMASENELYDTPRIVTDRSSKNQRSNDYTSHQSNNTSHKQSTVKFKPNETQNSNFLAPNRIIDTQYSPIVQNDASSVMSPKLQQNTTTINKPALKTSFFSQAKLKEITHEKFNTKINLNKEPQIQLQIVDNRISIDEQDLSNANVEQWDTGATAQKTHKPSNNEKSLSNDESLESQKAAKKKRVIVNFTDMETENEQKQAIQSLPQPEAITSSQHLRQDSESTAVMSSSHHQRLNSVQTQLTDNNNSENKTVIPDKSGLDQWDQEIEQEMDNIVEAVDQQLQNPHRKSKSVHQLDYKIDHIQEVEEVKEQESYYSSSSSNSSSSGNSSESPSQKQVYD